MKNKVQDIGIKYDEDKLDWSLMPLKPLESVVRLLMFGAKKYKPNNWMNVLPKERYYNALLRHLFLWFQGEKIDPDSGLSHLTAVICNAIFLWWHDDKEDSEPVDLKTKRGI